MRRRPGRGGDQLVVALEQDAALADRHAAPTQLLVDLRNAAVLTVAEGADQRDHVQPELVLRQRQGGFRLRPPRLMVSPTAPALTAPDLQAQANQTPQRHDRPMVAVADPHRPSAFRTGTPERNQDLLVRRLHTTPTPGHLQPPLLDFLLTPSTDSRFCHSWFFPHPTEPWSSLRRPPATPSRSRPARHNSAVLAARTRGTPRPRP